MASTMKALGYTKFGNPDELALHQVPRPSIGQHDVLIRVQSASVNPVDYKMLLGNLQSSAKFAQKEPSISSPGLIGLDVAGIVEEIGNKVSKFSKGDQVYAMSTFNNFGTIAEYFSIEEDLVAKKPQNVNFDEAASIPLVALTSYQALFNKAKVEKGNKVLVLGGSTATGILGIQLAKSAGAYVATTVSTTKKEFAKSLGADLIIDYKTENFDEILKGQEYDVVYDCAGGEKTVLKSLSILHSKGRYVTIVSPNIAQIQALQPEDDLHDRLKTFYLVESNGKDLEKITELVETNQIRVVIDSIYSFEQGKDAFEKSKSGTAKGKIVIQLQNQEL